MSDITDPTSVEALVTLTAAQAAMIDAFQAKEGLRSRHDAIHLLLDIALETVTSRGRRFWDKPVTTPEA